MTSPGIEAMTISDSSSIAATSLLDEVENDADDYDYRLMHAALVESWLDVGLSYETPRLSINNRGRSLNGKSQTHKRIRSSSPNLSNSSIGLSHTISNGGGSVISDNATDTEGSLAAISLSKSQSLMRASSTNDVGDDALKFQLSGDSTVLDDEGLDENDVDEHDDTELLELAAFLSVDCSLEKRDGTTSPASDVSLGNSNNQTNDALRVVNGRDATLSKLEQKASLLSVAGRTNVKLGQVHIMRNCYETRSIVKIRVKVISVTYGILLRWKNGLVNYVVLHKMPPDSFMDDDTTAPTVPINPPASNGELNVLSQTLSTIQDDKSSSNSKFFYADMSHYSNHYDYDKTCTVVMQSRTVQAGSNHETEVTILQPPWLVERPAHFPKPTLTVTVLKAQGLRNGPLLSSIMPTIQSFVKLSLSNDSHRTGIVKMRSNPIWEETDDNKAHLSVDLSSDRFLKVEICDSKPMKNVRLSVVYVPLALVESKGNNEVAQVTMPCQMRKNSGGGYGTITLSLSLFDPRKDWLDAELKARDNALNKSKRMNDLNAASCFEKPVLCGVVTGESTCAIGEEAGDMFTEWFNRWWFC